MIIYDFRSELIRQVTAAIDSRLTYWVDWLCSNAGLAFGDDPGPVYEMEDDLNMLIGQLGKLQVHFDYFQTPLDTVQAYRTTLDSFYQTSELVASIREKDRGSPEYTRKTLRRLESCLERLAYLMTFADPDLCEQDVAVNNQ